MEKHSTDPPRTRSLPVVSARSLKQLEAMGEEFFSEIKTAFSEDISKLFQDVREALKQRDLKGIAHAVHSLHGVCSNFGARRVQSLGKEIETRAKASLWEEAEGLLPHLRDAIREVESALASPLTPDPQSGEEPDPPC